MNQPFPNPILKQGENLQYAQFTFTYDAAGILWFKYSDNVAALPLRSDPQVSPTVTVVASDITSAIDLKNKLDAYRQTLG